MQADGSALPNFIIYDINTKIVTVSVSASQSATTIPLKVCAVLDENATSRSECQNTAIEIFFADTLAFS